MADPKTVKKNEGLGGVSPLTPDFSARANMPEPRPRLPFQPENPFGSITAGRHQFTILGDNDHADPSIIKAVADHVASMAKAGVKHLMIEYAADPETDKMMWQLYQNPPAISYDQIRKQSALFESASPETPEGQRQSGKNYAELIINCHKNGITLHFAGDDLGSDSLVQQGLVRAQREAMITAQPALHKMWEKYLDDPDYLKKIGVPEERRADLASNLLDHGDRYFSLLKLESDLGDKHISERMGSASEQMRADRFIDLAKGEKSVILFGAEHHKHGLDMNEALDSKLRAQALKQGTLENFEPTRVLDIHGSRSSFSRHKDLGLEQNSDAVYFVKEKQADITPQGLDNLTPVHARPIPQAPHQP